MGVMVGTWVIFTVLIAVWAANKGRNWFLALLASAILSPLVGFIIVAVLKDKKAERQRELRDAALIGAIASNNAPAGDTRACPRCAEPIKRAATFCRFCNSEVRPVA